MGRALAVLAATAFLLVSALSLRLDDPRGRRAVDLMPLWLGGQVLAEGGNPNDPVALEAAYDRAGVHVKVGGFYSYYPPTASLIARPLSAMEWPTAVAAVRVATLASLVAAAVLCAFARAPLSWVHGVVAAELLAGLFLTVRPTRAVLPSGQPGAIEVALTALALWGLRRDRGGIAMGLGIGLKLFPALLLPVVSRRTLAWVGGTLAVLVGGVLLHRPSLQWSYASDLLHFVNPGPREEWSQAPRPVLAMWYLRVLVGIPTLALLWWIRKPASERGALLLAWGGLVMAGSHHYHEALLLLPALGFVLAWPAQPGPRWRWGVLGIALLIELTGARSPFAVPGSLHWMPIGYATWLGCAARLYCERGKASANPRE